MTLLQAGINGIYISNPGREGYFPTHFTNTVTYAHNKDLKVAFEIYKTKFDVNTIHMIDLAIVFKDTASKFKSALLNPSINELKLSVENNILTKEGINIFYKHDIHFYILKNWITCCKDWPMSALNIFCYEIKSLWKIE